MLMFGDWGTGPIGENTAELLQAFTSTGNYDGLIHVGDLAYDLQDYSGRTGDIFGKMKEPMAAYYPYFTITGNHENYQNQTHYVNRFNMPLNDANNGTSTFYSFNYGLAHYLLFNTDIYFGLKDEGA
jgi:hypothetical protein